MTNARRSQTVRRRLMGTLDVRMSPARAARSVGTGAVRISVGFAVVLALGTLLLRLPVSATADADTTLHVAFFTAVSSISVTGLVVVDTSNHWSPFGQAVILVLTQIGGLGYMLGTTVILWAFGRRLGLRDKHLLRVYYGAPSLRETVSFAKGIAIFTLIFEVTGALLLTALFAFSGEPLGRSAWWGVFHSVSAFTNAGFTITGSDMLAYRENTGVLLILSTLIAAGSIGFLPIVTLAQRRSFGRLPLDHKLIFTTSAALLVVGAAFFTITEWQNETLADVSPQQRPIVGLFQSTSARTAGFSAVPFADTEDETKLSMVGLMFVGGAAGSASGGLKVGTFAILLALMVSTVRAQPQVTAFGRRIPSQVLRQATTLALYFVGLVFVFTVALTAASDEPLMEVLVEVMSAISTVGYSSIGTANFDVVGEVILAVAMLVGRFSPLILVLYMTTPRHRVNYRYPEDSVRLG